MPKIEWTEQAEADNAEATATRAAESGNIHVILGVTATYTSGGTSGECRIQDGATEIAAFEVHDSVHISLPGGLPVSQGNAVNVDLDASGGAANLGKITIYGRTEG